MITGPANFRFDDFCQPKPLDGYPDFPPDITCLFEALSLGQPQVKIYAGTSGIPPAHYMFTLAAMNPPQAYTENLGKWVIQSFFQMYEQIILDANTTIPGYMINNRMGGPAAFGVVGAAFVMPPWTYCDRNTNEFAQRFGVQRTNCDFENWQFWPELGGYRDDRPGSASALIIRMILAEPVQETYDLIVTAPQGYIFDPDCKVATYPSAQVFDGTATTGAILQGNALWVDPTETWQRIPTDSSTAAGVPISFLNTPWRALGYRSFDQRYAVWPSPTADTGGAVMLGCKGGANIARITLTKGLQAGGSGYLFRLNVLSNPPATPDTNLFTLEYAGEASEAFKGVEIWAFRNITIVPTTTATSSAFHSTWNLVTIALLPANTLPFGGQLRITAPPQFQVPTSCQVTIQVSPDNGINMTALLPTDVQWSLFLPDDVVCQGDDTASMRARLLFTRNNKFLKAGVVYIITLVIRNPETTTPNPDPWTFESYKDLTVSNLLDSATYPGFAINRDVKAFGYVYPSDFNANVKQRVDFNMSFPDTVQIGDTLKIVAPVTFYFSQQGSNECPGYLYMQGSLQRTKPICGGNQMSWELQEETVPPGDALRFFVQLQNPATTPDVNLFEVRHIIPDGTQLSSRKLEGWAVIPQLRNASVMKAYTLPLGQCRRDVTIAASFPCYAVGSTSAIVVTFIPTIRADLVQIQGDVNGDNFGFTSTVFKYPYSTVLVPTARSATAVLGRITLYQDQKYNIRIDYVVNPMTRGTATFNIATFTANFTAVPSIMPVLTCDVQNGACGSFPPAAARRDEKLAVASFQVLGYLSLLTTSRVSPIYYSTPSATVTFQLRATFDCVVADVLRITRPEGYAMVDGSLLALSNVQFNDTDQGLDQQRIWSSTYANPEDYYAVFTTGVLADTTITFSILASLPTEAYPAPFWTMRSYRILPLRDVDGEILDASVVPYPWIDRDKADIGTNDGAFPDFLLVGPIPFTITPTLQTPGAYTQFTLNLNVAQEASATGVGNTVLLEITAPAGFVFMDACFVSPINPAFAKCTGYRNTAALITIQPRLFGSGIIVTLAGYNPRLTPSPNMWQAAIFTDDPTKYVRWSEELGYEIIGMAVVYKGNNQLGESSSGFFTFQPVRPSPSPVISLVITPPPNGGFRLFCTGIAPLGFVRMPQCESGGVNDPLTLTFNNASLVASKSYTFGLTVYNPGGPPDPSLNYWGLSIEDYNFKVFDGNLNVPGLDLTSVPLRIYGIGWTSANPKVMATVMIQLRVLHLIPAGSVTVISIQAPEGIMYTEDTSTVRVIPAPLPLRVGSAATITGAVLVLKLDTQRDIPAALYNIRFQVINPMTYPSDNTWSVVANKDIDVVFSHVLVGYLPGQISPYELSDSS